MPVRRLLAELKRRQVYRAVFLYATAAWVLLEGADIVFPRLGLQDWTVNLVLALVVAGFPVAVILAWIFDITPEGISRTPPLSPKSRHHFSWSRIAEFAIIGLLTVVVGYLYLDRLSLQREISASDPAADSPSPVEDPSSYRAIAVLPFADMSETGDQAWFAEGIAEELLQALASVEELQVTARTSSFAFKDSAKTVAEIAEILGVQAVLEGSVRRAGDRVRITAQLIDAGSGYHIWSDSYERRLTDIFQLQNAIASSIVEALQLELGGRQPGQLIAAGTEDPHAYNAFIRGRALLEFGNPQSMAKSVKYFEAAVDADPEYASAWGHLAYAQAFTALWRATNEASGPARRAYTRALELDPGQSEALSAKAFMIQLTEQNWEYAGELYRQALSASDNSRAMLTYAQFYLSNIGQLSLALDLMKAAEHQDPLHPAFKSNMAMLYIWIGRPEAAIAKAREALELIPDHGFALMALVEGYTAAGNCAEALSFYSALPANLQREPRVMGRAGVCHAIQGDEESAREIYREIREITPEGYAIMQAALLSWHLGEIEETLDILENEVENQSWTVLFMRTYFKDKEGINEHPRYLELMRRVGLDEASIANLQLQTPAQ